MMLLLQFVWYFDISCSILAKKKKKFKSQVINPLNMDYAFTSKYFLRKFFFFRSHFYWFKSLKAIVSARENYDWDSSQFHFRFFWMESWNNKANKEHQRNITESILMWEISKTFYTLSYLFRFILIIILRSVKFQCN